MATGRHVLETGGETGTIYISTSHQYQTDNECHVKGKIESKCIPQITTWLKNCLEVMPMEMIKRTSVKENKLPWNGSCTQSHQIAVRLIVILSAPDSRI